MGNQTTHRGAIMFEWEILDGDEPAEAQLLYSITPGEPEVRYYPDGGGDPSYPASVEIYEVVIDAKVDPAAAEAMKQDFYKQLGTSRFLQRVEQACFEDAQSEYEAARERRYQGDE